MEPISPSVLPVGASRPRNTPHGAAAPPPCAQAAPNAAVELTGYTDAVDTSKWAVAELMRWRTVGAVVERVAGHQARRFDSLGGLDAVHARWRDGVALLRRPASGRAHRRRAPGRRARGLAGASSGRLRRGGPALVAGPVRQAGRCFYRAPESLIHQRVELRWDRDRVWVEHQGRSVAAYARSYEHGVWQPRARMRLEPPQIAELVPIPPTTSVLRPISRLKRSSGLVDGSWASVRLGTHRRPTRRLRPARAAGRSSVTDARAGRPPRPNGPGPGRRRAR